MPGITTASQALLIGQLIEELSPYLECATNEEVRRQVVYIPH